MTTFIKVNSDAAVLTTRLKITQICSGQVAKLLGVWPHTLKGQEFDSHQGI